ncbi:MAG: flagellar brake protein [Treponema sp.]|jgi:c-di-GMP-binding flagellar brake protein YcgR|nr:flagellar brake protein [Treponema sp.]
MMGGLYLLQGIGFSTWKETDPTDVIVFLIGLAAVVIFLVILNLIKKRTASAGSGAPGSSRRFSGFGLRRLAGSIGLDRDQTKMLEFVLKNDNATDPRQVVSSANLLDRAFKRAYRIIERSANTEEEAQEKFSLLFSTRNILEGSISGEGIGSTRQIAENTTAVISVGNDSYPVKVISSGGEKLVVENPQNALGTSVRLPRGSKVILSFFTKSSKGFSFESRILGTADSAGGPVLQLVHSSQIRRLSKRRFRRRQAVINSNFYFVYVEESGRKKEKKMVVDKRRLTGNIMDISIGGCSIKTNVNVPSGQRLKIEFMHGSNVNIAVLGQVLRTNRTGISTIMHIKFLKVPRRSMNAINALVFEYSDE